MFKLYSSCQFYVPAFQIFFRKTINELGNKSITLLLEQPRLHRVCNTALISYLIATQRESWLKVGLSKVSTGRFGYKCYCIQILVVFKRSMQLHLQHKILLMKELSRQPYSNLLNLKYCMWFYNGVFSSNMHFVSKAW